MLFLVFICFWLQQDLVEAHGSFHCSPRALQLPRVGSLVEARGLSSPMAHGS